jgi:hypothetical protein
LFVSANMVREMGHILFRCINNSCWMSPGKSMIVAMININKKVT